MSGFIRRLLIALALVLAIPTAVDAAIPVLQTSTASYTVTLLVGPVETMLSPSQAASAGSGEVMVQLPGAPPPMMVTADQGQPVNHHLAVRIYTKANGTAITQTLPKITITNQATHATETLGSVVAMYDSAIGQSDLHFGNNVYLPDGTYTIAITVGTEAATFHDVVVTSNVAPPGMAEPGVQPAVPSAMPDTARAAKPDQLPPTGGASLLPPLIVGACMLTLGGAMAWRKRR